MNCYGSGFITILNYSSYSGSADEQDTLTTESSENLLTEDGRNILI